MSYMAMRRRWSAAALGLVAVIAVAAFASGAGAQENSAAALPRGSTLYT